VETRLLERVNQVFVHSAGLLERKGSINPNTTQIPNGVDFSLYALRVPEPLDLAGIPHPRIGYTGWIKKQLNWKLLLELSDRHPEWSFVFVGAEVKRHSEIERQVAAIKMRKNVHFLGRKSNAEIAAYPQHFDVCIMPYEVNAYTNCIYPMKLHEYLAAGRPSVGSPIRSLLPFSGVVSLAESVNDWSNAIRKSLTPEAQLAQNCVARQAIAREYDWEVHVRKIARIIADRLGGEFANKMG
jgi:glycosyltransferase involved in cell wall biosynthesis